MFRLNVFLASCLVLASTVSGRAIDKNGLNGCGNDADKRSHCVSGAKGQVRFISIWVLKNWCLMLILECNAINHG